MVSLESRLGHIRCQPLSTTVGYRTMPPFSLHKCALDYSLLLFCAPAVNAG
jgi:hypothetical protein